MSLTPKGEIKYELKKAWKNGITHVLLSPLELIEKLCSLVPLPNLHLVRFWGVLAPNSKLRRGVIPGKTRAEIKQEKEEKKKDEKKINKGSWSRLLSRVFGIDVSTCRVCGGEMRIIASIVRQDVMQKILAHLGLSPRPPPIAPSRIHTLFAS
ncbi:MAG: transposase [Oligoflexales bacterium]|nr:transposase [Oligoflexales bacterium]